MAQNTTTTNDHAQPSDDAAAIEALVNTLFIATDQKDWTTARSLFATDLDVAMGPPDTQAAPMTSDELVGGWEAGLHAQKQSHHMTTNHQLTVEGDAGEVTAQGYAYNLLLKPAGEGFWEVWGVYTLPVARTETGWQFTGFNFEVKHSRGDDRVPGHTLE